MRAVVFRAWERNREEPVELGRAELDGSRVRFSGSIAPGGTAHARYRVDEATVFAPGGRIVTPADGETYLSALPAAFRGTRFWAEAVHD